MDQRKNSVKQNQSRKVAFFQTLLSLLVFGFGLSGLSQDFVFTVAPHAAWRSVVCSGDGTKLAAFGSIYYRTNVQEQLYVSSDSGATWRPANPQLRCCNSLTLTPDAATLVAVCSGVISYTSHDLGVTWKTNALPGPNVQKIALSDDGTKWVCCDSTGYGVSGAIYSSDDSGASWRATSAPVTNWSSVVCSGDGSYLAAVHRSNDVFTSSNRGVTWQSKLAATPTNYFNLLASSADGSKLVAIGDVVCVSTNLGADWITVGNGPPAEPNLIIIGGGYSPLYSISASEDASTLVGIRLGASFIWTSTNSGAQWTLHGLDTLEGNSVYGVASSGDGNRWLAAGGTLAYTWPPPPVALSFFPQGTNIGLFWPSNQIGLVLESSPSLSPDATWTPVTNDVVLGNYRFNVTASPNTSPTYFRLHKP
jgi:hypothetical protein